MKNKELKSEWDKAADFWDQEAGDCGVWHQQNDIDPVVLNILGDIKGKSILELGCGNGYLSRKMARAGAKITASDISKKMVDHAAIREKEEPLGIKYLVRDATNLEGIEQEKFDYVVANMCLIDIGDISSVLKEAHRVLKISGKIVFSITHPVFFFCDQKWIITEEENKKYFARAVIRYLSSRIKKYSIWKNGPKLSQYHRPIQAYFKSLKESGFFVDDFREIATKREFKKTVDFESSNPFEYEWYKYVDESEREIKEFAAKEIPIFIVFSAIKVI